MRPPCTPRGEPAKVTIANQARQIELMIARVQTLNQQLTDLATDNQRLEKERDQERRAAHGQFQMNSALAERIDAVEKAHIRLQGWQDCAREFFLAGGGEFREVEPFPSSAPGV